MDNITRREAYIDELAIMRPAIREYKLQELRWIADQNRDVYPKAIKPQSKQSYYRNRNIDWLLRRRLIEINTQGKPTDRPNKFYIINEFGRTALAFFGEDQADGSTR